jgi:hypothetical protein
MEFRIGDAKALATASQSLELEKLEALSQGGADFSLHLSPQDLDALVEELCRAAGHEMLAFTDVARQPLAGDRAESGVFLISGTFVLMVASIPDDSASEIAERWMGRVAEECEEPDIVATAETVVAVSELIRICRKAGVEDLDLVYCWSL